MDAVRNAMIAKGWARRSINLHTGRLKRLFKWGVSKELVPPSVHQALTAVAGLRAGRSAARESDPVRPVPDAAVGATLPHLLPVVAAMVKLQLLTGARPGEIWPADGDVDRTGEVWTIAPARHKTQHHGHARTIHVGPQAQAVLHPFLNAADPAAPCFSPAAAARERRARQHAARVTPASYGGGGGGRREVATTGTGGVVGGVTHDLSLHPSRVQPLDDAMTTASFRRVFGRVADGGRGA